MKFRGQHQCIPLALSFFSLRHGLSLACRLTGVPSTGPYRVLQHAQAHTVLGLSMGCLPLPFNALVRYLVTKVVTEELNDSHLAHLIRYCQSLALGEPLGTFNVRRAHRYGASWPTSIT